MIKNFKNFLTLILRLLFSKKINNFYTIPIIINNYNRKTTLKLLITNLEEKGYKNIYILDNQSTYPPLLEYYKSIPYKVFFLKKNYGSKALWKSNIWFKFMNSYFVYTDSDVIPVKKCPKDFLHYFYNILQKYPKVHKVGFSLKIDDLPDAFINKEKVYNWEKKFYQKTLDKDLFIAPIDTTFALYRPFSKRGDKDFSTLIIRTNYPYQAKHLPWYIDNNNLSEEERYYINSIETRTHWSRQNITNP